MCFSDVCPVSSVHRGDRCLSPADISPACDESPAANLFGGLPLLWSRSQAYYYYVYKNVFIIKLNIIIITTSFSILLPFLRSYKSSKLPEAVRYSDFA